MLGASGKVPYRLAARQLPRREGRGIPQAAILDVLVRLAKAAAEAGRLPHQAGHTAPIYEQLVEVLAQIGREGEIT